jgi:hypothetical protein
MQSATLLFSERTCGPPWPLWILIFVSGNAPLRATGGHRGPPLQYVPRRPQSQLCNSNCVRFFVTTTMIELVNFRSLPLPGNKLDEARKRAVVPSPHYSLH